MNHIGKKKAKKATLLSRLVVKKSLNIADKGWSIYFIDNKKRILLWYTAVWTVKVIDKVAFLSQKAKRSIYSLISKGTVSEQIQKSKWFLRTSVSMGVSACQVHWCIGGSVCSLRGFLREW